MTDDDVLAHLRSIRDGRGPMWGPHLVENERRTDADEKRARCLVEHLKTLSLADLVAHCDRVLNPDPRRRF